jgi:ribosomal-protein-alanine N-acetyltransferase
MDTMSPASDLRFQPTAMTNTTSVIEVDNAQTASDWRRQLPILTGARVVLRELRPTDAASLFTFLTAEEVTRHVSAPPSTVQGFERFIGWVGNEQAAGRLACYAITPAGDDTAIGVMQVRPTSAGTAECGAVIGEPFWGTGIFEEASMLIVRFAFETLGLHRLEARVSVRNDRCVRALRRMGVIEEGLLRKSLALRGERIDQVLFAMNEEDYRALRAGKKVTCPTIH